MMFASPPDMSAEWSDSGVEGSHRFLKRVWRLAHAHVSQGLPGKLDVAALSDEQKAIRRSTHLAIKQASQDVGQNHKFNTAIAQVMTLMNVLEKPASHRTGACAGSRRPRDGHLAAGPDHAAHQPRTVAPPGPQRSRH